VEDDGWGEALNASDKLPFGRHWDELGGGTMWIRRFMVKWGCYFVLRGYNRETAWFVANEFMARLESAVLHVNHDTDTLANAVRATNDDYGESFHRIYMNRQEAHESGGPPNQFIWKGELHFYVLTNKAV